MKDSEIIFFKDTFSLYDKYNKINVSNNTEGFNRGVSIEAQHRIKQLDYLLDLIREMNSKVYDIQQRSSKDLINFRENIKKDEPEKVNDIPPPRELWMTLEEASLIDAIIFKIELHTEHFYYVAGRLRKIIRYLPGLGKKFESEGIRNVRNLLIEHPEDKNSRIFTRSFACGCLDKGPVIKAIRENSETQFPDKGLFLNAIELRNELNNMLIDFLEKNCA